MITFPKYEAYQESGVAWLNEVPRHWKVQLGRGYLKPKKVKNTGNKVKTVLSLSYGKIIVKPEEKLYGLVPESFETYQIVEPGDIIVRATDLQNDHTSLRIGLVEDYGIITSAYLCLQPSEEMDSRFAYYLLHAYDLLKIYYGMGSGLRQNLDYTDFKYLPLTVPELEEQKRIVEFLDRKTAEIDEAIAHKQRLIELLQEQKAIVINQAVTKGLNPDALMCNSGIREIGDLPNHWKVIKLKTGANLIDGDRSQNYPKDTDIIPSGIPFLSSKNIVKNQLNLKYCSFISRKKFNSLGRGKLERSDLIITVRGTIGSIAIFNHEIHETGFINAQMMIIRCKDELIPEFLYYVSQSDAWNRQIAVNSYGSAQQQLSRHILKNISIMLPDVKEQISIISWLNTRVEEYQKTIKKAEASIKVLNQFRSTLISNAVTGKIKV